MPPGHDYGRDGVTWCRRGVGQPQVCGGARVVPLDEPLLDGWALAGVSIGGDLGADHDAVGDGAEQHVRHRGFIQVLYLTRPGPTSRDCLKK